MPVFHSAGRPIQISYSTNVHPARGLSDVEAYLRQHSARVRDLVAPDRTLGLALHIGREILADLRVPGALDGLLAQLNDLDLAVVAINAFPLGDFHAPVVKDQAYAPDWTTRERAGLTCDIARAFARLLPAGGRGTMSTLAGSFKPWGDDFTIHQAMAERMVSVAEELERIEGDTGRRILLGLEPEPFTTLETGDEVLAFFSNHLEPAARAAGMESTWRRHLGLNVDLCHHAVWFESLPELLDRFAGAGITIGSVHAAAALSVEPVDEQALSALARFDEARYLHQVVGIDRAREVILRERDLPPALERARERIDELTALRCHFHVPLDASSVGGLATTADETAAAVRHLLARGLSDQVVVETYTWDTAPLPADDLSARIAAEMTWLATAVGLTAAP